MARQRPLSSNPATLSSTLDELNSNQPMVPSFALAGEPTRARTTHATKLNFLAPTAASAEKRA